MKGEMASYRRREDGILEIVRTPGREQTVRGTEIAVAFIALVFGAMAAFTGSRILGVVLVAAGIGVVASRLLRDRLAAPAGKRRGNPSVLPPPDDRVGLRVIRFEERAPVSARVPGSAVRLPGTAASPQE